MPDPDFEDPLARALWLARRDALADRRLAAVPLVASGSLITPVPLAPGRHEVDFGQLGTLRLEVTA